MPRTSTSTTPLSDAVALHGSISAAALALGMPRTSFRRRAAAEFEAAHKAKAAVKPKPAIALKAEPAPAPAAGLDISALAASIAALADAQRQHGEFLRALLPVRDAIRVPERQAEPEKPRIRVQAVHRPVDAARPVAAPPALGSAEPYRGEIFGITRVRKPITLAPASRDIIRLLAIGDSHFHPVILRHTLRAMTLVAIHARGWRPHWIWHAGDASDMASLCDHEKNDTWRARIKPSVLQDLDCYDENWGHLSRLLDLFGVTDRRHLTLGNHDGDWPSRFENRTPETHGMITGRIRELVTSRGWTISDFGQIAWLGDVALVHHPKNIMGKAPGGQSPENTVATQSTRDFLWAHTHRYAVGKRPKFDGVNVTNVNVGSSMPDRYVGDFAQDSMGEALDYGCCEVTIFDGRIQSSRFVHFRELEATHGAEADRLTERAV